MYCGNGHSIVGADKFCRTCGSPAQASANVEFNAATANTKDAAIALGKGLVGMSAPLKTWIVANKIIAGAAALLLVGGGAMAAHGSGPAFTVGTCFHDGLEQIVRAKGMITSCKNEHSGEVIGVIHKANLVSMAYQGGPDKMALCRSYFEDYVGTSYSSSKYYLDLTPIESKRQVFDLTVASGSISDALDYLGSTNFDIVCYAKTSGVHGSIRGSGE